MPSAGVPQPAEIAMGLAKEGSSFVRKSPRAPGSASSPGEGAELRPLPVSWPGEALRPFLGLFLIGSSYGIEPALKAQADLLLSMGEDDIPHHLARIMVLEQLYRAESIQAGNQVPQIISSGYRPHSASQPTCKSGEVLASPLL